VPSIEADQPYDIVVDLRQVNRFRIEAIADGWTNAGEHGPENTPYAVSVGFYGHQPRTHGRVIFMTYDQQTLANLVQALIPLIDSSTLVFQRGSGTIEAGLNPNPAPVS
jgi:hypothetical protein